MAKVKIVHIAQSNGGVSEYLYMFIKNSQKQFEHILIVSLDYKEQIERFQEITSQIYYVDMQREIDLYKDFLAIKEIRKILKKQSNYILYLHSSKAGALGRIAKWFDNKTKILYNAHGWYFNATIGKKKKIFTIIEKILAYRANKIINISKSEYNTALQNKITKKEKMCVIENGIDFEKFKDIDESRQKTRQNYNIKNEEIVIGAVGRLALQKDPMTLIRAFQILKSTYKNSKLMFVGSGELKEEIVEYATKHNLIEDIIITGWVKEVEKYIPAFDIAVLPSKWEGFGLVIVEYMANYKPIVASKVGGIEDIIENEKKGKLFTVGNEKELAQCLCDYIENRNKIEKDLQDTYDEAKQRYNIRNVVEKTENIIKELSK